MLNIDSQKWQNTKAERGRALPAGIYKGVIKNVVQKLSKSGKHMLAIAFDIAEGEYEGYFMDLYGKNVGKDGKEAKWPNGGVTYMLIDDDHMGRLKAFVEDVEESNPGYTFNMEETTLKNKVIGLVMGEEEYRSQRDGEIHTSVKCSRMIPLSKMADAKVPRVKKLKEDNQRPKLSQDDWSQEIPF
jgi:hypothetical protein